MKRFFTACMLLLCIQLFAVGDSGRVFRAWVCVGGPPGAWDASGEHWPVETITKTAKEAGVTDIDVCFTNVRGAFNYVSQLPGALPLANKCPPDAIERLLAAAKKEGLRVWLVFDHPHKITLPNGESFYATSRRGAEWHRQVVAEVGELFKKQYPETLAGIAIHEICWAQNVNPRSDELPQFQEFCEREYGERYPGNELPSGKTNQLWDRRFNLYRIGELNYFNEVIVKEAAKYGMETTFLLYNPEERNGDAASCGYDSVAIEKLCPTLWCQGTGFTSLRGAAIDCGISYRGCNTTREITTLFRESDSCLFEFRAPFFPEWQRAHYRKDTRFTKTYGDYFAYLQKSPKVMELFFGRENASRWCRAGTYWQGGENLARIGFVISSLPAILRSPISCKSDNAQFIETLHKQVTRRRPVQRVLAESLITLDPVALRKKFDLLILPENQSLGVSREYVDSLKKYVALGGKLLAVATPITTANRDLTDEKNVTQELLGVAVTDALQAPGFTKIGGKKVWTDAARKATGTPLPGTAFFPLSFSDKSAELFFATLDQLLPEPDVLLENNSSVQLYNACRKDGVICLSLPADKPGKALLKLRLPAGNGYRMRNLFTGETLADGTEKTFADGVEVGTKYLDEPLAVAIGPAKKVAALPIALVPGYTEEVFADLGEVLEVEHPEVPLMIPDKPGIKVGIYGSCLGTVNLHRELDDVPGLNVFEMPRLDGVGIAAVDVIVVPQPTGKGISFYKASFKELRVGLNNGKGLILCHKALDYAPTAFPELLADMPRNKIQKDTRLTTASGKEVIPGFTYDHYVLEKLAKGATVLATDESGETVAAWAHVGKGRVAGLGTLPGWFGNDSKGTKDGKLPQSEKEFLIETIKLLGGAK